MTGVYTQSQEECVGSGLEAAFKEATKGEAQLSWIRRNEPSRSPGSGTAVEGAA